MDKKNEKEIYLAGGCFWGVQAFFEQLDGVSTTEVGYANGSGENPTYQEVCQQKGGFAETLRLNYDPSKISLIELLGWFFKIIDPCSLNRQADDIGLQYRSGIYYQDEKDCQIIINYLEMISVNYQKKIVTEVLALQNFYPAEEYHQDYLKKNPQGYCHIDLSLAKKK